MIKHFEEIEAWQLARELTKAVYAIAKTPAFDHDFGLRDQIRRTSASLFDSLFPLSVNISKLIAAFITPLANSPLKGSKFNRPGTCHLKPVT